MAPTVSAIGLWLFIYWRTMEALCLFLRELLSIDCSIAMPVHSKILPTVGPHCPVPTEISRGILLGEIFSGRSVVQSAGSPRWPGWNRWNRGTAVQRRNHGNGRQNSIRRVLHPVLCTPRSSQQQNFKLLGQNPVPSIPTSLARCFSHPLLHS